jgi:hypothetical protein
MASYRVYFIDPVTKHHSGVIEFEADDDQHASKRASETPSWMDRELWNLERKVADFRRREASHAENERLHRQNRLKLVSPPVADTESSPGQKLVPFTRERLAELSAPSGRAYGHYGAGQNGLSKLDSDLSTQSRQALFSDRAENRRAARTTLAMVLARLTSAGGTSLCRVRNLSSLGAGIEAQFHLRQGERLTLCLAGETLLGSVAWSDNLIAGVQVPSTCSPEQLINRYSDAPERPRLEHEYLDVLSAEMLQSLSVPPDAASDHDRVRQRFLRAARAHLKFEDWAVYPALIHKAGTQIARDAARLQREVGGLEQQLNQYSRHWMGTEIIEKWAEYRRESIELIQVLTSRMRQEEAHLYSPAADLGSS